ncbi:hypothetical protein P8452_10361 [Trifolium repens]|nr:hypothetical protein P8452_10361 [Trifolium repens]
MVEGSKMWNFSLLKNIFPPHIVDLITQVPLHSSVTVDSLIWHNDKGAGVLLHVPTSTIFIFGSETFLDYTYNHQLLNQSSINPKQTAPIITFYDENHVCFGEG